MRMIRKFQITDFQVATVNKELADTNMRLAELERIAELTGGKCLSSRISQD